MLERLRYSTLQSGLVLFWAIWLTIVTLTNLFDALNQLGLLPEGITFVSYNFDLLTVTVGAHGVPPAGAVVLFGGVLVWEMLASVLFWRAWAVMRRGEPGTAPEVTQAFVVSLALWCSFLIATELTVNFVTAPTHKSTLIAQLVTLLVIRSAAHNGEQRSSILPPASPM